MLISTELKTLGDLLRTNKDTMVTRGVASVRSPVCKLQQFDSSVQHDDFVEAVVRAFKENYGVNEKTTWVEDNDELTGVEYIRNGMKELRSWDWLYGQTPEFTYVVKQTFDWGEVTAELRSKHGLLLSCELQVSQGSPTSSLIELLSDVGSSLKGARYGFLEGEPPQDGPAAEVYAWLKGVMES
ncbi:hypothetical protein HGRIS_010072 [Hohenbuehelia grisea]|uniref:Putative lipoate-protein ligase A n=1 Tax=Hohenbuehelia grisea TaxID=104357 RepID=A0ABR3J3J4_9AGAR